MLSSTHRRCLTVRSTEAALPAPSVWPGGLWPLKVRWRTFQRTRLATGRESFPTRHCAGPGSCLRPTIAIAHSSTTSLSSTRLGGASFPMLTVRTTMTSSRHTSAQPFWRKPEAALRREVFHLALSLASPKTAKRSQGKTYNCSPQQRKQQGHYHSRIDLRIDDCGVLPSCLHEFGPTP